MRSLLLVLLLLALTGCAATPTQPPTTRTVIVFGIGATMDYTCDVDLICTIPVDGNDGHREPVTVPVGTTVRVEVVGGITPTCLIADPNDKIALDHDVAYALQGNNKAECSYTIE